MQLMLCQHLGPDSGDWLPMTNQRHEVSLKDTFTTRLRTFQVETIIKVMV